VGGRKQALVLIINRNTVALKLHDERLPCVVSGCVHHEAGLSTPGRLSGRDSADMNATTRSGSTGSRSG
jgi:hypothetical protein